MDLETILDWFVRPLLKLILKVFLYEQIQFWCLFFVKISFQIKVNSKMFVIFGKLNSILKTIERFIVQMYCLYLKKSNIIRLTIFKTKTVENFRLDNFRFKL